MDMRRQWEELEEDCLVTIFEMLALDDLILAIPFVCTSWFKASLNRCLWRSLDLRCWDTLESRLAPLPNVVDKEKRSFTKFLKFVVSRSQGSVVSLHFPTYGVSVDDLLYASNECPNLQFLMFSFISQECYARLPELVGSWRKLEYLCLIRPPLFFSEIMKQIQLCCDNFKGLKVAGYVVSDVAKAIADYLPNIKALDLSWSIVWNDNLKVILDNCRGLEELNLMHCENLVLDDEMLSRIKKTVKCFKHDCFQWGASNYIDNWYFTDLEVDRHSKQRGLYEILKRRAREA